MARTWKNINPPAPSRPTYIDELILSTIKIRLSFRKNALAKSSSPVLNSILSLGVAPKSLDEARVILKGIKLVNCYDTLDGKK